MKKAIGMAVLNLMVIVAGWGVTELFMSHFNMTLFAKDVSNPVFFAVCSAAAVCGAVYTFLKERKKSQNTAAVTIR